MASEGAWSKTKGAAESVWGMRGVASAQAASFNSRLGSSYLGRSLQMGAAESFGFTYSSMGGTGGTAQGFLGQRGAAATGVKVQMDTETKLVRDLMKERGGRSVSIGELRAAGKEAAMASKAATRGARISGAAFGGLNLAFTAFYAYEGFKKGGGLGFTGTTGRVIGAAGGVAESVLWSAGIRAVGGLLGTPAMAALAAASAAYGTYQLGKAGIAHEKNIRELEFGGSEKMQQLVGSAGAATHRQRAVTALNNTHLNGRMSMGNEALMTHVPFR